MGINLCTYTGRSPPRAISFGIPSITVMCILLWRRSGTSYCYTVIVPGFRSLTLSITPLSPTAVRNLWHFCRYTYVICIIHEWRTIQRYTTVVFLGRVRSHYFFFSPSYISFRGFFYTLTLFCRSRNENKRSQLFTDRCTITRAWCSRVRVILYLQSVQYNFTIRPSITYVTYDDARVYFNCWGSWTISVHVEKSFTYLT